MAPPRIRLGPVHDGGRIVGAHDARVAARLQYAHEDVDEDDRAAEEVERQRPFHFLAPWVVLELDTVACEAERPRIAARLALSPSTVRRLEVSGLAALRGFWWLLDKFPILKTIEETVVSPRGQDRIAGVLSIGEHGRYPSTPKTR